MLQAPATVLLGATSYAAFSGYWPFVENHSQLAADDPMARAYDQTNRAISRNWTSKPIVVVSDSYQVPDDGPWASHTTVIGRGKVAQWKQQGAVEEIIVFASHLMWNGLLAQNLVDEGHLMVGPAAFGGGTAAFEAPASLTLKETRRSEGSDNVLLVYGPA